jgi:hypothetical protein
MSALQDLGNASRQRNHRAKVKAERAEAKKDREQIAKLNAALYTAVNSGRIPAEVNVSNSLGSGLDNLAAWLSGQGSLFEVEETKRPARK